LSPQIEINTRPPAHQWSKIARLDIAPNRCIGCHRTALWPAAISFERAIHQLMRDEWVVLLRIFSCSAAQRVDTVSACTVSRTFGVTCN
jgi:hypothetical protein